MFIAHERDVEPGWIGERAAERGFDVDVCEVRRAANAPAMRWPDPREFALIVPLGSAESAYDDALPWLPGELTMLREAVAADVPVFGICFGAQILARALGGHVGPAPRPEVGWFSIDTTAPDLVPAGPWLQWHLDAFTLPPGATVLARSDVGIQAYRHGRRLGVQFHPEVTPSILAAWIRGGAAALRRAQVDAGAFQAETERRVPQARAAAYDLFDQVWAAIGHRRYRRTSGL